jgi:hypothetical protein
MGRMTTSGVVWARAHFRRVSGWLIDQATQDTSRWSHAKCTDPCAMINLQQLRDWGRTSQSRHPGISILYRRLHRTNFLLQSPSSCECLKHCKMTTEVGLLLTQPLSARSSSTSAFETHPKSLTLWLTEDHN